MSYNNTVSDSGRGIDVDKASYENMIHDNIIINIPKPSDALYLEDGAANQNTLHSNILIDGNGKEINLEEQEDFLVGANNVQR